MELEEILKNSIHYPINDMDRFIRLAIPNLILGLLLGLLMFLFIGSVTSSYRIANLLYAGAGALLIIIFIALIVVLLVDSGIMLDVIRNTINNNNNLPELNIADDFIMGLKSFIVSLVYILVPMIIYTIVLFLAIILFSNIDYSAAGSIALIITLVFYVVMFIITLIMPVILATLAKTNSISQALQVTDIWNTAQRVGFVKLFLLVIVIGIFGFIIGLIGTFLSFIPVIGYIITLGFMYTYFMLFSSRCYGLLFVDMPESQNHYEFSSPQYTNQNQYSPNQAEIQRPKEIEYDNKANNQLNYGSQETIQSATKTCGNCGSINPQDAQHCGQCGNKI